MADFNASGNWEDQIGSGGSPSSGGQAWQQQSQKPWYQNEAFAGAVAGGISGISNYLMEQERQRGQKSLLADRIQAEERMVNSTVQRSSSMPLLQRFAKPKKKKV